MLVDGGWREIDTEQDLARAERGRRRLAGVTCPAAIPAHWLHRLDAAEWLAAAETELAHAEEKLSRRAAPPGVTHARRAAGHGLERGAGDRAR